MRVGPDSSGQKRADAVVLCAGTEVVAASLAWARKVNKTPRFVAAGTTIRPHPARGNHHQRQADESRPYRRNPAARRRRPWGHRHTTGRSCQNFPDPQLQDGAGAYCGENLARLQEIMKAWDPEDVFTHTQGIPLLR